MIGTKLAHYQITAHIGSGGMGEVYQATDTKLGRSVAIKFLPEAFRHDSERVTRFEREARILASLSHPHIGAIYGLEYANGTHFLVLELIDGETLANQLMRGPTAVDKTLRLATQIAEALEAAHQKGIVHRDLKPANIKVTPNGTVKVLDFGLAKVAHGPFVDGSAITMGLTAEQTVVGTPAYMAPEQVQGQETDSRVDVWAFGVVLYELLTGTSPFQGDSVQSTLASVLTREPDFAKVPATMRRLLRACLQKEPRERLAHIRDWRLLLDEESAAAIAVPARTSKLTWGVAALGFILGCGLAWRVFRPPRPPRPEVSRFQIPAPEGTTLGIYSRISPDGRKVLFTAMSTDGRTMIWVRDLESEYSRPLPGTEIRNNIGSPFWSFDSKSIAYADGNQLKRVDTSGTSPPRIIMEGNLPFASGAWSSSGVVLCGSLDIAPVVKVADTGGTPTPVTPAGGGLPVFLPDQRHFLYHLRGTPDVEGIYIGSIDLKPEEQPRQRLLATAFGAVFTPSRNSSSGHILFLGDDKTLRAQAFDPEILKLLGEPVPIAEKVGSKNYAGYFSASNGGTLTYRHNDSQNRQLVWLDRKGDRVGAVGEPSGFDDGFRISPDGQRVAVAINENGNFDIWVLGLKKGSRTRLTFDPRKEIWPIWSADGKFVLFTAGDIYTVPADGSESDKILYRSEGPKYPLSWSADGKYLLFAEIQKGTGFDTWLLSMRDGKASQWLATTKDELLGRISADGRWVAYQSNETGSDEVFVRPFTGPSVEPTQPPGGKWQISRTGSSPMWREDSRELFYLAGNGDLMSVKVSGSSATSLEFEPPQKLFTLPITASFEVTENGSRFLALLPDAKSTASPITVVLNWEAMLDY